MSALLEFQKIEKYYTVGDKQHLVLKGLDFEVNEGETISILGKSGSGKSTLLNIIGLLDNHTGGKYLINGKDVEKYKGDELAKFRAQTFGFIFQQFNLLPKLSVLENVTLPAAYSRDEELIKTKNERAMELLEMLEISDQAHKPPRLLSGGQQQRVAIARSLINKPRVIIGDEPTGSLDSKTANQILDIIFHLNQNFKVTLIMVTHDEDLAQKCERIIRLKDGLIVDKKI